MENLHIPLVVLNGMLGAFRIRDFFKLFVRKKVLLIPSQAILIFYRLYESFAGIDKESRTESNDLDYETVE